MTNRGEVSIAVLHGSIRATRSGPSYSHNSHHVVSLFHEFLDSSLESGHQVDLLVSNAYPTTGNIPAYIKDNERARNRITTRSMMINPKTMSQGSPLRSLLRMSVRYQVNILFGPIYEVAGPRNYVTVVHVRPDGVLDKYRKIMLTPREEALGLHRGRTPKVFTIHDSSGNPVAKIGVFVDEDLFSPMIFQYFNLERVDVAIGFMLPYESRYLPPPLESGGLVYMRQCLLDKVLTTRAVDIGAPLILVGGVVNIFATYRRLALKHWGPTTIIDPEDPENDVCLSIETKKSVSRPFLTPEEADTFKRVLVSTDKDHSTTPCDYEVVKTLKKFCSKK